MPLCTEVHRRVQVSGKALTMPVVAPVYIWIYIETYTYSHNGFGKGGLFARKMKHSQKGPCEPSSLTKCHGQRDATREEACCNTLQHSLGLPSAERELAEGILLEQSHLAWLLDSSIKKSLTKTVVEEEG